MLVILCFFDNDDWLFNLFLNFDESLLLLCFEDKFWEVGVDLKFVLLLYNSKLLL